MSCFNQIIQKLKNNLNCDESIPRIWINIRCNHLTELKSCEGTYTIVIDDKHFCSLEKFTNIRCHKKKKHKINK